MRCTEVQAELSAFMDGELGMERSEQVATHLTACAGCAEEFRCLRAVVHWATLIPEEEPPAQLHARILSAIANVGPTPVERVWIAVRQLTAPRPLAWVTCACATAAFAVALAGTRGPSLTRSQEAAIVSITPVPKVARSTPATPAPNPPLVTAQHPGVASPAPTPEEAAPTRPTLMTRAGPSPAPVVKATPGPRPAAAQVESRVDPPTVRPEAEATPVTMPKGMEPPPTPGSESSPSMMALGGMPGNGGSEGAPVEGMAMMTDTTKPPTGGNGAILPDDDGLAETRQFFEELKRNQGKAGPEPARDRNPAPAGGRRPH
jgi:hypothetical protein